MMDMAYRVYGHTSSPVGIVSLRRARDQLLCSPVAIPRGEKGCSTCYALDLQLQLVIQSFVKAHHIAYNPRTGSTVDSYEQVRLLEEDFLSVTEWVVCETDSVAQIARVSAVQVPTKSRACSANASSLHRVCSVSLPSTIVASRGPSAGPRRRSERCPGWPHQIDAGYPWTFSAQRARPNTLRRQRELRESRRVLRGRLSPRGLLERLCQL